MTTVYVRKIIEFKLGCSLGCYKQGCDKPEEYVVTMKDHTEHTAVMLLCETHLHDLLRDGGAIPKECLN